MPEYSRSGHHRAQQLTDRSDHKARRRRRGTILWVIAIPALVILVYGFARTSGMVGRPASFVICKAAPIATVSQSQASSSTKPPEQPQTELAPGIEYDDSQLLLVNAENPLPPNSVPLLMTIADGYLIDSSCGDALQLMLNECEAAGYFPVLCSTYRSFEIQQQLFEGSVQELVYQGFSREEAERVTALSLAAPGTSEHQTGLAADIVDADYQLLDVHQADTPTQQWLMTNCWKYGFILRYPQDKTHLTGITWEPWHYRYVGNEPARQIYEQHLCLEEYLQL